MSTHHCSAVGGLILRVALGLVFIAHSLYLKLVVYTLSGTAEYFASVGLPGVLAYVVFAAEALGGIALIAGVYTRLVAAALIPIALGATWAHLGAGWLFTNEGGGWEYPAVLVVTLLVQFFVGGGALALRRSPPLGPMTGNSTRCSAGGRVMSPKMRVFVDFMAEKMETQCIRARMGGECVETTGSKM